MSPFLNISCKSLIRIAYTTIKVSQLIESHLFKVRLMEIVGQSLFEVDSQTLVEEIEEGVHERCWNGNQPKIENSLDEDRFVLLDD